MESQGLGVQKKATSALFPFRNQNFRDEGLITFVLNLSCLCGSFG